MQIIDLIYFDDYREESAGSKRFLLKLKKICVYLFSTRKSLSLQIRILLVIYCCTKRGIFLRYIPVVLYHRQLTKINEVSESVSAAGGGVGGGGGGYDKERIEYIKLLTKTVRRCSFSLFKSDRC